MKDRHGLDWDKIADTVVRGRSRWPLLTRRLGLPPSQGPHHALQAALLILSATAAAMIALPEPWHGRGFVVGLASQPLWFVATWRARQWGMFALSAWYTGAWIVGIRNHFIS